MTPPPAVRAATLLLIVLLGSAATAVAAMVCSLIGQYYTPWPVWGDDALRVWQWPIWFDAVWQMRIVRLATAGTVGAGLAAAGMALQGMLRNPLAEPYILGISSGAGVGVLLGPLVAASVGLGAWATTPVLALTGALLTCAVVYGVAQRRGRLDPYVLLLSGVIISVFNSAVTLTVMQFADPTKLLYFIGWGMGKINYGVDRTLLVVCVGCVAVGWLVLLARGSAFNALGLGDEVAASSGVPIHYLRLETFVVVGLMTAAAVALAGPIGFVGLIIPHVCRLMWGSDHRRLVLVCGFVGASAMMIADTLARSAGPLVGLADIPVGIITAMAGGPFFIALLRRRFREKA